MRYIYFGFLVFLSFAVNYAKGSSLTIQPRFTTSFRFTATDAWNLDLQFAGQKAAQIYLEAKIMAGGKTIVSLRSNNFTVNPGVQSYSATTMATAQLQYISTAVADIESLTGSFPAGNYKVCYNAHCVNADCDGNGADAVYNESPECFELVVEPPTPLLLAFPDDKSEIDTKRPTFNWIPPAPIASVQGFNYLYTLVEKRKNQSCADAILSNRPLYKQSGVELPVEPYPAELNDLDTGKTYCWKVEGLVGVIPVAQSEVWEFKLKTEKIPKYSKLAFQTSNQPGIIYYNANFHDTVKIVFDQEYNINQMSDWNINISIQGETGKKSISDEILNSKFSGASNILFVASDIKGVKPNIPVLFEFINEKNEKSYARIIFKK